MTIRVLLFAPWRSPPSGSTGGTCGVASCPSTVRCSLQDCFMLQPAQAILLAGESLGTETGQ